MNKAFLIGRIVNKIELRYTTSNMAIAKFTLAINRDTKNKQGEYETDFISCVAYNKTAELISKYLDKGSQIAIEGHIQIGSYEKDGKKTYTTDIVVERLTFLEKKATQSETQEATQTEIVQKAMSDNPYENFGQQIQMDNEGLPF
jgi:single-strand DNA-binding protein